MVVAQAGALAEHLRAAGAAAQEPVAGAHPQYRRARLVPRRQERVDGELGEFGVVFPHAPAPVLVHGHAGIAGARVDDLPGQALVVGREGEDRRNGLAVDLLDRRPLALVQVEDAAPAGAEPEIAVGPLADGEDGGVGEARHRGEAQPAPRDQAGQAREGADPDLGGRTRRLQDQGGADDVAGDAAAGIQGGPAPGAQHAQAAVRAGPDGGFPVLLVLDAEGGDEQGGKALLLTEDIPCALAQPREAMAGADPELRPVGPHGFGEAVHLVRGKGLAQRTHRGPAALVQVGEAAHGSRPEAAVPGDEQGIHESHGTPPGVGDLLERALGVSPDSLLAGADPQDGIALRVLSLRQGRNPGYGEAGLGGEARPHAILPAVETHAVAAEPDAPVLGGEDAGDPDAAMGRRQRHMDPGMAVVPEDAALGAAPQVALEVHGKAFEGRGGHAVALVVDADGLPRRGRVVRHGARALPHGQTSCHEQNKHGGPEVQGNSVCRFPTIL